MNKQATVIAVTGKGGVGKTSISAVIVKLLTGLKPGSRILAVDADPAVGLSTALGVEFTKTIDDIRLSFIEKAEAGDTRDSTEMLYAERGKILDIIVKADGFSFITVGRPEAAGCYCKVHGYLKDILDMLSREYDYIVVDGEAGIEQMNRRVMEAVTHLLLVSDTSKRGLQVIESIKAVADNLVRYEKTGAVINRLRDDSLKEFIKLDGIQVIAHIPEDNGLNRVDIEGKSVFELSGESPVENGVREVLKELEIIS